MGPDAGHRELIGKVLERTAAYLLLVLLVLLIARSFFDLILLLDYEVFAVVIATLFLIIQFVRSPSTFRLEDDSTHFTHRQTALTLVGLVGIGTVLRLYALGNQSFWFDEAITTTAAIGLLEKGTPTFPSGIAYWRGFPHTLLVAGSLASFGTSEWAARLPAVIAGVATIPVTYWLGREAGNRRVGLVAAVLVTFLTWEIAWSRQARMYQLLQLAYALTLIGLARVDRIGLRDRVTLALVAVGTLLAALTHRIGLILFPVTVGYLAVHRLSARGGFDRRSWVIVGGMLLVAAVLELQGIGPIGVSRTVLATDINHFDRYHGGIQSTLGVVYLLAIVGLGASFRRWEYGFLLALALLPPVWILVFHTQLFAMRYLYFTVPFLAVYVGFVMEISIEQARHLVNWLEAASDAAGWLLRTAGQRVPTAVLATALPVLVVLIMVSPSLTFLPQVGYALGPNAPQPDFKMAYGYVDSRDQSNDVLVAGWTAPAQYYHGQVDYWLVHDLTSAGRDWTTDDGREVYSGAVPISTATELRAVINCNPRGWIVVDRIVYQKLSDEMLAVVSNLTVHDAGASGMRVYSWTGSGGCPTDDGLAVSASHERPQAPPWDRATERIRANNYHVPTRSATR